MVITHEACLEHIAGEHHPERPNRLKAVWDGVGSVGARIELLIGTPKPADLDSILRVHDEDLVASLVAIDQAGGGAIDCDTGMTASSWHAARLAAGAGLHGISVLEKGGLDAVFCAIRPPGHHASSAKAMGFCLINHVAVAASLLVDRGERVMIFDYDAHHGNGTQEIFYDDPRVLFVSLHQMPLYPGSGALAERGSGCGIGTTVNVPMPPGATGDHYQEAWTEVIAPIADSFDPTWLLISAGFDGHRDDPIAELGLTSADFGDLTLLALEAVPKGRCLVFLEGGYELEAIRQSTQSVISALAGERLHLEVPSSGGPGASAVTAALSTHVALG